MIKSIKKLPDFEKTNSELISSIEFLAEEFFVKRAHEYDLKASFAEDNFVDLFNAGVMAAVVDPEFGGLGFSPDYGNVKSLWKLTRAIAKSDLSFSRCWEGHNNALMLIDKLATKEQKQRWFNEVIDKGHRWAAWSGEPQSIVPNQEYKIGTHIVAKDNGYLINGNKVFATSAIGANWAILLVSLSGPGGAREIVDGENNLLMLACDLSDPSISFDGDWWDPIGMRSTVSYKVNFDNTFIPKQNCIGHIGDFLTKNMQSRFTPHYAVSFLGALDAAYEYAYEMVLSQNRQKDPYVQHHVAEIKLAIDTLELWSSQVASLLDKNDSQLAPGAASQFRYLSEKLSEDGVQRCIKICGARCLNKPSRLERIYRDLTIYVQHDNADHILATLGKNELGIKADSAFHKLKA